MDVHAKFFEPERAIRLAHAIEPYNPMWMEESVRPENYDAMKKLSDHVNIPLASGESNYGIYEFKQLIERQALSFRAAGYLRLRRRAHDEEDRSHGRSAIHDDRAAQSR